MGTPHRTYHLGFLAFLPPFPLHSLPSQAFGLLFELFDSSARCPGDGGSSKEVSQGLPSSPPTTRKRCIPVAESLWRPLGPVSPGPTQLSAEHCLLSKELCGRLGNVLSPNLFIFATCLIGPRNSAGGHPVHPKPPLPCTSGVLHFCCLLAETGSL